MARSILVVDDDNGVRDLMSRWLQSHGYWVASASGAVEALGMIDSCPPAVALCDIRMPGPDGLWLADRIRQRSPETAVIMATGVHDAVDAAASLGDGVVDYLTKPFGRDRLQDAVLRGIQWHRSARDSRCWREKLEAEVHQRQSRLVNAIGTPLLHSDDAVDAMFAGVANGEEAYAHGSRVAALATAIAQRMNLSPRQIVSIRRAALLHDLGKLVLPDALLHKPAPLTEEELTIVRRYPALGSEVLAKLPEMSEVADIVRHAQERPDGRGYPAGLHAADLSIGARIIAVANAYDTMVRPRVYRDAITVHQALVELKHCCGTQFDPDVVAVVEHLIATGRDFAPAKTDDAAAD